MKFLIFRLVPLIILMLSYKMIDNLKLYVAMILISMISVILWIGKDEV